MRITPCATKWQRKWLDLEITHPLVQEAATAAEAFCGRWFNNDRSKPLLVLVGDVGTCKTHIARKIFHFCSVAAMNAFNAGKHGQHSLPSAVSLAWPATCAKFYDKQVANNIVADASEATLRIIDDIGAEKDNFTESTDRLCQILSRTEDRFTVITTNIEVKDWPTKFDVRISDRLMRDSVIKSLRGVPSFAIWKRTQKK
jgi:DNA replication protein DnaC